MPEVLVSTSSFDIDENPSIAALQEAGLEVACNPHGRKLTEDEIADLLGDSVVGLLAGVEPLTAGVIAGAPQLRVISRCGVGLDNVDLAAASAADVKVLSTPDAPVDAVVEMSIGLMLATLRGIAATDRALRDGQWSRFKGGLLKARTVGILGFGRIGKRIAGLCAAFGARVIVHDPAIKSVGPGLEWVAAADLWSEADLVSLHVPYNEATHHLVNAETLAAMPAGAILINTARGGLVDEDALLEALDSGHLAAAGLDVYTTEPYTGPLLGRPQLVLTPHLASSAVECRRQMELEAAANLYAGLCEAGAIAGEGGQ